MNIFIFDKSQCRIFSAKVPEALADEILDKEVLRLKMEENVCPTSLTVMKCQDLAVFLTAGPDEMREQDCQF